MRPLRFLRPASLPEALDLLATEEGAYPLAGGSDLIGEMKEGTVAPRTLVSLQDLPCLTSIETLEDGGLAVGAMVTLARLEEEPRLLAGYPALAQAAASVATPQIRNVATLGGNLCQRPRCWFYRSAFYHCRKKGGAICYALNGDNRYHAILGGRDCVIVHPSDTAVALLALDATVEIAAAEGSRIMPLAEFFAGPERDITRENVLERGQLLTHVHLPPPSQVGRSLYLKVRQRASIDFALVSVAAALTVEHGVVRRARVALGGVAPIPWRARGAEALLEGAAAHGVDPEAVGWAAVEGARPLRDNHYKVPLAANLVARAVARLLGRPEG